MPTWTVTTTHTHQADEADTTTAAWDAAHSAAIDIVRARILDPLTLDVDGQAATIRPPETGDETADIAATVAAIEDGRAAIIAAHRDAE